MVNHVKVYFTKNSFRRNKDLSLMKMTLNTHYTHIVTVKNNTYTHCLSVKSELVQGHHFISETGDLPTA